MEWKWDKGKVVTGYKSAKVIVWDCSINSVVKVVTLVGQVVMVMSLTWDMERRLRVVEASKHYD